MALGLTGRLTEISIGAVSWGGGKGSQWVGLMTLPPSCSNCLEILEPQLPRALTACPGLCRDCYNFVVIFTWCCTWIQDIPLYGAPWRAIWLQIEGNQQVFPPLVIMQKLLEICTKGIFSTEINFTRSNSQICICIIHSILHFEWCSCYCVGSSVVASVKRKLFTVVKDVEWE